MTQRFFGGGSGGGGGGGSGDSAAPAVDAAGGFRSVSIESLFLPRPDS